MLTDIQTMMWKEWREVFTQQKSNLRGSISGLIVFAYFSIFFPSQYGVEWVSSPIILLFSAWFPFLLVTQLIADSFAGERERHTLETLLASRLSDRSILVGKVLATSIFAWLFTLLILLVSLVTVNLQYNQGDFVFFSTPILIGTTVLSLSGALISSQIGVFISLRASTVKLAQQTLSLMAMAPILLIVLIGQLMSAKQKATLINYYTTLGMTQFVFLSIAILATVNLLLFFAASRRFQRTRLILD